LLTDKLSMRHPIYTWYPGWMYCSQFH